MTTAKTPNAKYGYVITSTPGLIADGAYPLEATALAKGEIEPAIPGESSAAVFATREAAEAAMLALVPEGSTPAVFAGLNIAPTWEAASQHVVYGWVTGEAGFVVPTVD